MYRIILFVAFSFSTLFSFAQINFEKGYFIDNNGKKTECYIKNKDWRKNPIEFEYRVNLSDESSFGKTETVQEFGITNFSKYVRATVDIDRSKPMQSSISEISDKVEPNWKNEILFLKVLVQGKANLYYYEDDLMKRFFYSNDKSPIQQLIFKEYSLDGQNLKTNKQFQQQLEQELNCDKTSDFVFGKIGYSKNELEKYFDKYNSCFGTTTKTQDAIINKNKSVFKLKPLIGLNTSKIEGFYTPNYYYKDLMFSKSSSNLRIGAQLEYVLEFNRNKWSLLFETAFENTQSTARYKATSINYQTVDLGDGEIKFTNLDLGFGARHYMYVSKSAALFLDFLAFTKLDMNSSVTLNNLKSRVDNSGIDIAGGFGASIDNFSAELRYRSSSSFISSYNNFNQVQAETYKNKQFSFILTYTLFQTKK